MSANIPNDMLLSDLLKATGYNCPENLKGKTFAEATEGGGETMHLYRHDFTWTAENSSGDSIWFTGHFYDNVPTHGQQINENTLAFLEEHFGLGALGYDADATNWDIASACLNASEIIYVKTDGRTYVVTESDVTNTEIVLSDKMIF